MTSAEYVFEWLAVLFVITGLLIGYLKAAAYWHSRFHHPDPLEPIPIQEYESTYISLRKMK